MKEKHKTRSHKLSVSSILSIRNYIIRNNIGFNGYSYLCFIVNRYQSTGLHSTYNSIYTYYNVNKDGSLFRIMKDALHTLENKGFIVIDRSEYVCKLYPTDKALLEIGKFL